MVDVIIQFREGAISGVHQPIAAHRGVHRASLDLIRSAHYSIPVAKLAELADDPDVEFIHPNRAVQSAAFPGKVDHGWMSALGLTSYGQKLAWDGAGIGAAVLDSGISNHSDITGRVVYCVVSQAVTAPTL